MKPMSIQKGKRFVTAMLVFSICALSVPFTTHAQQAYTQTYQPRNTEELIAYLQGVIAQLQAQLAIQRGQTVQTTATVATYGLGPNYGGQVLGASTQNQYQYQNQYQNQNYSNQTYYSPADLDRYYRIHLTQPDSRELSGDSVEFETVITFTGAPYVDIWFEYGSDIFLEDKTRKERVYSNGYNTRTYRERVDDVDDDGYVRAVAEIPNGNRFYSIIGSFDADGNDRRDNFDDDEPDVETGRANNIEDDEAVIEGEVDMNDYRNGLVFFVYGEDEDLVEEIEDEYDTYSDIDEDGDDLQKVRVDSDLDDDAEYRLRITGLDDNTDYYYQICVEFEDDDDDDVIICGGVEDFETD